MQAIGGLKTADITTTTGIRPARIHAGQGERPQTRLAPRRSGAARVGAELIGARPFPRPSAAGEQGQQGYQLLGVFDSVKRFAGRVKRGWNQSRIRAITPASIAARAGEALAVGVAGGRPASTRRR